MGSEEAGESFLFIRDVEDIGVWQIRILAKNLSKVGAVV
jgi:hypothetical protein